MLHIIIINSMKNGSKTEMEILHSHGTFLKWLSVYIKGIKMVGNTLGHFEVSYQKYTTFMKIIFYFA